MKTTLYSVYILQSEMDGSYYVGSSADPVDRLAKHNRPHKGYTASKQPWKLGFCAMA
jgi:putative endonuclease